MKSYKIHSIDSVSTPTRNIVETLMSLMAYIFGPDRINLSRKSIVEFVEDPAEDVEAVVIFYFAKYSRKAEDLELFINLIKQLRNPKEAQYVTEYGKTHPYGCKYLLDCLPKTKDGDIDRINLVLTIIKTKLSSLIDSENNDDVADEDDPDLNVNPPTTEDHNIPDELRGIEDHDISDEDMHQYAENAELLIALKREFPWLRDTFDELFELPEYKSLTNFDTQLRLVAVRHEFEDNDQDIEILEDFVRTLEFNTANNLKTFIPPLNEEFIEGYDIKPFKTKHCMARLRAWGTVLKHAYKLEPVELAKLVHSLETPDVLKSAASIESKYQDKNTVTTSVKKENKLLTRRLKALGEYMVEIRHDYHA